MVGFFLGPGLYKYRFKMVYMDTGVRLRPNTHRGTNNPRRDIRVGNSVETEHLGGLNIHNDGTNKMMGF